MRPVPTIAGYESLVWDFLLAAASLKGPISQVSQLGCAGLPQVARKNNSIFFLLVEDCPVITRFLQYSGSFMKFLLLSSIPAASIDCRALFKVAV